MAFRTVLVVFALLLGACGDDATSRDGGSEGGAGAGGSGGSGGSGGGDPTCPALPAHRDTLCDADGWCAANSEANVAVEALAPGAEGDLWIATTTDLVHRGDDGWSQQEALPVSFAAAPDGSIFAGGWEGIYELTSCGGFRLHAIEGAADFRVGWASSSTDAWFAATARDLAGSPILVHWDGLQADRLEAPGPIAALWGAGPDDVWAGGQGLFHWDGSGWSTAEDPGFEITGLWGSAADDLWAIGRAGAVARWNGTGWAPVASGTGADLLAVSGGGADDVWIAAAFGAGEAGLLHWDGATLAPVPGSEDHGFVAIAAAGAGSVWAASESIDEPLRQLIRWGPTGPGEAPLRRWIDAVDISAAGDVVWVLGADGATARYRDDDVQGFDNVADRVLYDIEAVADGTAWAVGEQGLVLRFDGTGWAEVEGIEATHALLDVEADGDDVWIAGAASSVLHGVDGTFTSVDTGLAFAHQIAVRDGEVWVAGEGGLTAQWNGTAFESRDSIMREVDDVAIGPGGDAWALADGQLLEWDGRAWLMRADELFNAADLEHDPAGTLWVSGPMLKRWDGGAIEYVSGGDAQGGVAPVDGAVWTVGYGNAVLRFEPALAGR